MTGFQTVTYRIDNQVAVISLNRPETLNSFNTGPYASSSHPQSGAAY